MADLLVVFLLVAVASMLPFVVELFLPSRVKKWRGRLIRPEFRVSLLTGILVAVLRCWYPDSFPLFQSRMAIRWVDPLLILAAAYPAAWLAVGKACYSGRGSVPESVFAGACMEIPQRLLAQNLFSLAGPAGAPLGCLPQPVWLNAVLWAMLILLQGWMRGRLRRASTWREALASIWFSLGVGLLYAQTGRILFPMVAHGFERWLARLMQMTAHSRLAEIISYPEGPRSDPSG